MEDRINYHLHPKEAKNMMTHSPAVCDEAMNEDEIDQRREVELREEYETSARCRVRLQVPHTDGADGNQGKSLKVHFS
jgi:hypothetical protein